MKNPDLNFPQNLMDEGAWTETMTLFLVRKTTEKSKTNTRRNKQTHTHDSLVLQFKS